MQPTHFFHAFLVLLLHIIPAGLLEHSASVVYERDGDLILGGLFPMHNYDLKTRSCGEIREPRALKTVEAMSWTIEKINNDTDLLPGVSLGFEIYDTCFYDISTLGRSIHFIPPERSRTSNCTCSSIGGEDTVNQQCSPQKDVVGVIGAARSASSIQAATLFGLYKIPQISYLSTSDELSNKKAFKYFFRVVPPDRHQVQAMIDIILHYEWTYVSFLYSDDDYGRNGNSEFSIQAERRGICTAWTEEISDSFTAKEMNGVVENLRKAPFNRAVAVVLFMHLEEAKLLFQSVLAANVQDEFTWLASDGIGSLGLQGMAGVEEASLGTLSVIPFSERLPEFDQYIYSEGLLNTDNPWLEEYIDAYTNCSVEGFCGNQTNPTDTLVIDSVYVFAHALDALLKDNCDETRRLADCTAPYDGALLLQYLSNTSFESLVNGWIEFNENGESAGKYAIDNIQFDQRWGYQEVRVGDWDAQDTSNRLRITDRLVRFYTNDTNGKPFQTPMSSCSPQCPQGYAKKIFNDYPCCWDCMKCQANEAVINGTECHACEAPTWPDANATMCVTQQPVYMSWNRWDGAILIVLSALGFLLALSAVLLYLLNFTHPFISNSDPTPTLVIMVGILLCLTACLLVAIPPTVEICYFVRMLPGIGLALIFYPFCLKCVRLYRIFRHAKKTDSTEEAQLLNVKKQMLVMLIGLTVQLSVSLFWIFEAPAAVSTKLVKTDVDVLELHVYCNAPYGEILSELLISAPWLALSCLFTLLARNLPDNNYEARTATFAANATALSAVVFNLIYLGLAEPYQKQFYRFLGIYINAITYLFCVHVVKIYAAYSVALPVDNAGHRVVGIWRRNRAGTNSSMAPIVINRQSMAMMTPVVSSTASEDTRL